MRDMALLLEASPGRLEFALRLSLIAAVTTYVVQYYQTPEAALTVYLLFFMNKPDRTSSILQQLVMMLLITLIITAVVLLAMAVMDSPFWRVFSMGIFSTGFLFLASSSKLKPIGGTLALVIGYTLDLLGSAPSGELALRGLLYGWLIVVIPALTSLVVNLWVAPGPKTLVFRTLQQRLKALIRCLESPSDPAWVSLERLRAEGNDPILKSLKLASLEHTLPAGSMARLRMLAEVTFEWMTLLSMVPYHDAERLLPLKQRYQRAWVAMSAALSLGRMEALTEVIPIVAKNPPDPICQLLVERIAAGFDRLRAGEVPAPSLKPGKPDRRPFFLPDAFTNPDHVHYALKTTAAAMVCYLAYTLMDWPGIHTAFITCYIVSLGTAGESVEKLRLRLLGCLFGAALGMAVMLTIMPWIDAIESLLLVVCLGTFLSAWVAGGSPRIAYAGFQIAFAFYLCVIQGAAPEFDMAVARDRVIGVLLGNLVAFAMTTEIWPVSLGRQIDIQLQQLIQGLKARVNRTLDRPWCETGPRLHAQACQIRERLGLASLEPVAIRPTDRDLATRYDMLARASRLNDALLMATRPDPPDASAGPEGFASAEIRSALIELEAMATQISALHEPPRHA